MSDNGFISISRQSGLMREMNVVANNIANASTTGYKREGAIFSEFITGKPSPDITAPFNDSISMGRLGGHGTDFSAGGLKPTYAQFDIALESEGFFQLNINGQNQLTRNGHFQLDQDGRLVTAQGFAVLDPGGGEILLPLEIDEFQISPDGTISANGQELGQIGVVSADPIALQRAGDNLWIADQTQPVIDPQMRQGFLESSNVNPVMEIARMIQIQRSYDAGLKLMALDDERIKQVISTVRQIR